MRVKSQLFRCSFRRRRASPARVCDTAAPESICIMNLVGGGHGSTRPARQNQCSRLHGPVARGASVTRPWRPRRLRDWPGAISAKPMASTSSNSPNELPPQWTRSCCVASSTCRSSRAYRTCERLPPPAAASRSTSRRRDRSTSSGSVSRRRLKSSRTCSANGLSVFCEVAQNDTIYSELLLTDVMGRLVAASNVTSDYLQADEDWWRDTFSRGGPHISDAQWDESAKTYAIEIAVPVFAPGSAEIAGVLKAVTNSREMLAAVSGVRFGRTGEAVLVRKDGSLVVGRQAVPPDARFFAAPLLRESLGLTRTSVSGQPTSSTDRATDSKNSDLFQRPDSGWRQSDRRGGAHSTGHQLPPSSVARRRVSGRGGALRSGARPDSEFLALLALVVVAVLVLALWFSMRLAALPLDLDMHLVKHARVHRIDEDKDEENEGAEPQNATAPQASGTVIPDETQWDRPETLDGGLYETQLVCRWRRNVDRVLHRSSGSRSNPNPIIGTWKQNMEKSTYTPGPPPSKGSGSVRQYAAGDDGAVVAITMTIDPQGLPSLGAIAAANYDGVEYAQTQQPRWRHLLAHISGRE